MVIGYMQTQRYLACSPVLSVFNENLAHLVSGTSHDGWENGPGSVIASEASFTEPGAIVTHQGGAVLFFTHSWSSFTGFCRDREEAVPAVPEESSELTITPTHRQGSWPSCVILAGGCPQISANTLFILKCFHQAVKPLMSSTADSQVNTTGPQHNKWCVTGSHDTLKLARAWNE